MSESSIDREERIRQAANQLFLEVKQVSELTIEKILALAGEPSQRGAFRRVFPGNEFFHLRQCWVRQHQEVSPLPLAGNSSSNCGISCDHAWKCRHDRGMVSEEATAVQRPGQLSMRERRPSQPHCAAAAGERGSV